MSKREVIIGAKYLPFSKVIRSGELIFVSGMVGRNEDTHQIDFDIKGQTNQLLQNMQKLLENCGSSLDNLIKITIYLTDMRYFSEMNEEYSKHFSTEKGFPTRTCVAVCSLPDKDAKIEMDVIAEAIK